MALWILDATHPAYDPAEMEFAVLADSVTEWAFGPLFRPDHESGKSARDIANEFLAWLEEEHGVEDARALANHVLWDRYGEWVES